MSFKPSRQLLFFPSQVHFRGIVVLKRGIELLVLSVKISCKFGASAVLLFELLSTEKNSKMRIGNLNTMKIFLHILQFFVDSANEPTVNYRTQHELMA